MRLIIIMEIKCPSYDDKLEAKLMCNLCCYSALIGFSYLCTLKKGGSIRSKRNDNNRSEEANQKLNFDLAHQGIY